MKIRYINHSGFILEDSSFFVMIDCCGLSADSAQVQACAGKRFYILASHAHGDHFDKNILDFGGANTKWILSGDIRKKIQAHHDTEFLVKGGVYSDEFIKIKAYGSTDVGISFYIEAGGKKIFHAGDLNNWHWKDEDTAENAAQSEQAFLSELKYISRELSALDAAMFPVDPRLGRDYTLGARQFLDSVKTGLFLPMHFWDNYNAANAFRAEAESRGSRFAQITAPGDVFEI